MRPDRSHQRKGVTERAQEVRFGEVIDAVRMKVEVPAVVGVDANEVIQADGQPLGEIDFAALRNHEGQNFPLQASLASAPLGKPDLAIHRNRGCQDFPSRDGPCMLLLRKLDVAILQNRGHRDLPSQIVLSPADVVPDAPDQRCIANI